MPETIGNLDDLIKTVLEFLGGPMIDFFRDANPPLDVTSELVTI